ncbi:MAG: hypothetical protein OXE03_01915 [Gammaproteobacteria bacterium]|nr:hypothetical protein [Gammaproteobacteria bacterium]
MRLRRLSIRTLPGIEREFTFEPPAPGVNIVTGPNAIGKSSLARALGYLLRPARKDDPPLALEAEFDSDATHWRVLRTGSQLSWYRDGNPATPPILDQHGSYRLSVEHLLADDARDRDFARELRNRLRGGFDLDAPRRPLGARFAQNDEKNLHAEKQALRQAERDYDELERKQQEELPRLNRELANAKAAQECLERLQQALDLHKAIGAKKICAEELEAYPPAMDKLRGDERKRLAGLEQKRVTQQDKLREQERRLESARTALAATGFENAQPDPTHLDAIDGRLQQLGKKEADRNNRQAELAKAEGGLHNAREQFNGAGQPPRLDRQSLEQAAAVAAPLLVAQARQRELQLKIDQTGEAPDGAEINRLYDAGSALREWLALHKAESGLQPAVIFRRPRIALWAALAASGVASLLAWLQQVLPTLAATLVALTAAASGLFSLRRRPAPGLSAADAKQRFQQTGLTGPSDWTPDTVQDYLRVQVDERYAELVAQRARAQQAERLRAELREVEADITRLAARKREAAQALGFDPEWPSVSPDIFLQHCRQLSAAENHREQAHAALAEVTRDSAEDLAAIRDFLEQWRRAEAPPAAAGEEEQDLNLLQASFRNLQQRVNDAKDARAEIARSQEHIQALTDDIAENLEETKKVFTECELEPDAYNELDRRLGLLGEWQAQHEALLKAGLEEELIRSRLLSHPEIISTVDNGKSAQLQEDFAVASAQAAKHAELVRSHTQLTTRLADAGKDHRLSQARAAVDSARAALADKLEDAFLSEATELLLNDVEQAFHHDNEPEVLSRARALFREITANAFDLRLDKDGTFSAQDLEQQMPRNIGELSSGTRMQLLLALRLAWIEAQEQGGETLPLFLDEALTTSDEERFIVMVNSLERLAGGAQGRQIFYLSARRHDCVLWQQATGNAPPVIDLAQVRFREHPAQDYDLALPPALPSPESLSPEDYASVLGVPLLNPRLEPGLTHLFHLLRDDLNLLYQLMDTWRITTLGQLEALLHSDAAPAAVAAEELRARLKQRCQVARVWTALWRQGRGRPVDRIALEQSDAVSARFLEPVTNLATSVNEDGKALLGALRAGQVSGFRTGKIEELEHWLAAAGYTDQEDILPAAERQRQTLQQTLTNPDADTNDTRQQLNWLEAAAVTLHT